MPNKAINSNNDINNIAITSNNLEKQLISIHSCNFSYTTEDFSRPFGIYDYMLLFTAQGSICYNVDSKNEKIIVSSTKENTIALFTPFEPHYFSNASPDIKRYWIHFNAENIETLLDTIKIKNKRFFNVSNIERMEDMISELMQERISKKPFHWIKMSSLLCEILIEIARENRMNMSEKTNNIHLALNYIQNNYSKHITVDELSEMCHLSKYYFIKSFKHYTGNSPYYFLTNVRMQCAKDLLVNTSLKISEISNKVGFDDPLHFSKIFKETNYISPKAYREKRTRELSERNTDQH